jgi:hypothetical protein
LNEAQVLVDLVVMVGVKTNLLHIEGLGPVDVGHRNCYKFEFPVHNLKAGRPSERTQSG